MNTTQAQSGEAIPSSPRRSLYSERIARFSKQAESLGRRSRSLSNLRGLSFGIFVFSGLYAAFGSGESPSKLLTAGALVAFLVLVRVHSRVMALEDDALRWVRVNRDALARVEDRWSDFAENGERHRDAAHPYSDDLDLFGSGSLFQRLSVAHTRFGQNALAETLLSPASTQDIPIRQAAIRRLAPELEFRQRLEASALALSETSALRRLVGEANLPLEIADRATPSKKTRSSSAPTPPVKPAPNPEPLLEWAESTPTLSSRPGVVWGARILPMVTLAALLGGPATGLPFPLWALPLAAQALIVFITRSETTRVFTAVSATEGGFLRYGTMLELVENCPTGAGLLDQLRARLQKCGRLPSAAMKEFRSAVSWFELRHNGMIHPLVNLFLCWDVNCVLLLERWQQRSGKFARDWFQVLGEVEALSSWAGLCHDEPEFAFPTVTDDGCFDAKELGHPLVPDSVRVGNDVQLPGPGTALLVTGSNMSGKSTLLRSMGLAVVMALAGGPVCAKRLRTGNFSVRSSVRVSDSLARGVSHFYAEIGKLKGVMEATQNHRVVFFLLDEILHGTNSRERQIGARAVITQLLERGAMGAVSTHDMELARLPDHLAALMPLVHFREDIKGDQMVFDYRLRQGPVTAGNALRLMKLVGLNVPLE